MAFSARGREENRCVHVWLGKSEVTALTHRYVSSYAHLGTPQRGGEGQSQTEKRKERQATFSSINSARLKKQMSEYAFQHVLFFLLFEITMILIID